MSTTYLMQHKMSKTAAVRFLCEVLGCVSYSNANKQPPQHYKYSSQNPFGSHCSHIASTESADFQPKTSEYGIGDDSGLFVDAVLPQQTLVQRLEHLTKYNTWPSPIRYMYTLWILRQYSRTTTSLSGAVESYRSYIQSSVHYSSSKLLPSCVLSLLRLIGPSSHLSVVWRATMGQGLKP